VIFNYVNANISPDKSLFRLLYLHATAANDMLPFSRFEQVKKQFEGESQKQVWVYSAPQYFIVWPFSHIFLDFVDLIVIMRLL
jgi:hypothetical protein